MFMYQRRRNNSMSQIVNWLVVMDGSMCIHRYADEYPNFLSNFRNSGLHPIKFNLIVDNYVAKLSRVNEHALLGREFEPWFFHIFPIFYF
jgi:hypothetical protein